MHVCVCCSVMSVGLVSRFPIFHRFEESWHLYVAECVLINYDVISISQSLFISDPKTE